MFFPHFTIDRMPNMIRQHVFSYPIGFHVALELFVDALGAAPPVVYRVLEVCFFAVSIESNHARMICAPIVGISSS